MKNTKNSNMAVGMNSFDNRKGSGGIQQIESKINN
jgi:hypothetical protein